MDCSQVCVSCADACSAEGDPKKLVRCIRLNQDCADICAVTARVLGRQSEPDPIVVRSIIEACAKACAACATECERHAHMKHCETCAAVCRACEAACRDLPASKATA